MTALTMTPHADAPLDYRAEARVSRHRRTGRIFVPAEILIYPFSEYSLDNNRDGLKLDNALRISSNVTDRALQGCVMFNLTR